MNKSELIDAIADETKLSKKDSENALNAALKAISATVQKGGDVALKGFGTFKLVDRPARENRNPRTGAIINSPATKIAKAKLTFMPKPAKA